jgi:hypothetical protein
MIYRKSNVLFSVMLIIISAGCATKVEVSSTPSEYKFNILKQCADANYIGSAEINTDGALLDPSVSRISDDFLKALSSSRLFKNVSGNQEQQADNLIKIAGLFTINYASNRGTGSMKAIMTGLLFGAPAPFLWWNEGVDVIGVLDVTENNNLTRQLKASSSATASYQIFSEGDIPILRTEAINKAKQSVYRQLLNDFSKYCSEK